jgi:hypothetical protein
MLSRELLAPLDRLIQEFGPALPAGVIIRNYARSVRELRAIGVHSGLPDAAEAMARHHLNQRLSQGADAA